ncbi:MAG: putative DNA-binding domain-containing protein [Candidatus Berkiella sp.]
MLPLVDLQQYFKSSIFNDHEVKLYSLIVEGKLDAKKRLQIYRNNIFISLTESLNNVYPTVFSLVGEDYFKALAKEYIIQYPSTSGDLHTFGDRFSDFLSIFSPVKSIPYLPDVASLEWAAHQAFHAAKCMPFDFKKLEVVYEKKYGELKFKLNTSAQLLAFNFPVLHIWRICQVENKDKNEIVNLSEGAEKVLVLRRKREVCYEKLSEGEFSLLSAFLNGFTFETACDIALQIEPNININFYLEKHLKNETIIDFTL